MKSFNEWRKENNLNEFFGLFNKPKAQEPAMEPPKYNSPPKAWCPFCNAWSAAEEDAYYPNALWVWHCAKCGREWDSKTVAARMKNEPSDYGDRGTTVGIFLKKDDVKPSNPSPTQQALVGSQKNLYFKNNGVKENLYSLYLAGVVSEDAYYESEQIQQGQANDTQGQIQPADINQVASQLQFQPTSKKKLTYQYAASTENMPAMSYTVAQQQMPVVTTTADGKETQNTAEPNDIIMSGPSREQYVVKSAKFPKLYQGQIGGAVHPEQSPRNVAIYGGNKPITFTASWGESMILKPGDYLVKEAEGKFYRIAKQEYEQTYNPPGKVG